ncbi:MAG: methyltransferase domain-containing protein [Kangiellaceae bacterium]|nr:methyltransferase domain-containing protein [Kangiellaceae bacterium]
MTSKLVEIPMLKMSIIAFLSLASGLSLSADQYIYKKAISHPDRPSADRKQDESRKPLQILPFSKIVLGAKVLEIGAGGGYTTELVARVIGDEGHIYAETLSPKKISKDRLNNVTALRRHKLYQLPDVLAENSVKSGDLDIAIVFFALHDIMMNSRIDSDDFLSNIYNSLKPGGYFIVLDNAGEPDSGLSMTRELHRIGENYVKEKIISAGFKFDASTHILRNADDDVSKSWRDIRGKQDRFAFRFVKPK